MNEGEEGSVAGNGTLECRRWIWESKNFSDGILGISETEFMEDVRFFRFGLVNIFNA